MRSSLCRSAISSSRISFSRSNAAWRSRARSSASNRFERHAHGKHRVDHQAATTSGRRRPRRRDAAGPPARRAPRDRRARTGRGRHPGTPGRPVRPAASHHRPARRRAAPHHGERRTGDLGRRGRALRVVAGSGADGRGGSGLTDAGCPSSAAGAGPRHRPRSRTGWAPAGPHRVRRGCGAAGRVRRRGARRRLGIFPAHDRPVGSPHHHRRRRPRTVDAPRDLRRRRPAPGPPS